MPPGETKAPPHNLFPPDKARGIRREQSQEKPSHQRFEGKVVQRDWLPRKQLIRLICRADIPYKAFAGWWPMFQRFAGNAATLVGDWPLCTEAKA